MTRKDYVAIAERFRLAKKEVDAFYEDQELTDITASIRHGYLEALRDMADDLSQLFADDNPRFDNHRFQDACQLELDLH
tara:strand:- start:439 stop:675 length:237 start_codon:yes stop_codon:yes gene_type:complete